MNNYWSKHKLTAKSVVCNELIKEDGEIYFNTEIGDGRYVSINYDYAPDSENSLIIIFDKNTENYVAPTYGWLISDGGDITSSENNSIYINDKEVAHSESSYQPQLQMLIKKNDVVSVDSDTYTLTFLPCKSEQLDFRIINTPYDIWKGAVFEENGQLFVKNLWIPDVSGWHDDKFGFGTKSKIKCVIDEKAYTTTEPSEEGFFCNIQTSEIVVGGNTNVGGLFCGRDGSVVWPTDIVHFKSDLSKLKDGTHMFFWCDTLTEFEADMPNLEKGHYMFERCYGLTSFSSNLNSLTDGYEMFLHCSNLNEFTSELPSLKTGGLMFYGCGFTSFDTSLSSLTRAGQMFYNCGNLVSFTSDLSSLEYGGSMFVGCTSLSTFTSDLTNLTYGHSMFNGCKLNKESVLNIVNCLKNTNVCSEEVYFTIGIDESLKTDTDIQSLLGITEGATYVEILSHGGGKWKTTLQWNP